MSALKINIKWGKEKFNDVEVDPTETGLTLKSQVFALTGVPPERQKCTATALPSQTHELAHLD
jgi:ubiquitin carboxyl-terminal hydrolase 14